MVSWLFDFSIEQYGVVSSNIDFFLRLLYWKKNQNIKLLSYVYKRASFSFFFAHSEKQNFVFCSTILADNQKTYNKTLWLLNLCNVFFFSLSLIFNPICMYSIAFIFFIIDQNNRKQLMCGAILPSHSLYMCVCVSLFFIHFIYVQQTKRKIKQTTHLKKNKTSKSIAEWIHDLSNYLSRFLFLCYLLFI